MKYKAILFALAAAVVLTACEDKLTEREKLDSRTVGQLDVQYAIGGEARQALAFDHAYSRPVVDVVVSNDGLRWDLESDSDWCKVVPGEHRGSGTVMLEIEANESFEDRTPATLTFKAGDFRGFRIQVDQSAAAFIISQPYFVAGNTGGSFNVNVTTLAENTDWTFEKEDWMNVVRGAATPSGSGTVTTPLQISVGTDYDESRLGTVELSAGLEKDAIRIWQFGTEGLTWHNGSIFFGTGASSFSMIAPTAQIRQINKPDFVTMTGEYVSDILEKLTFSLDENLSDCGAARDVVVSFTLANSTSTVVALPPIKQDYTPAGGLMTAAGLQLFADKVANDEPTTDWQNDEGWVVMLQDIDMSGVTGWAGIGTETHPFSGKFDGKGHSITRLTKATCGIFSYCSGASESSPAQIKDVKVDKKCSFYIDPAQAWSTDKLFGCIVGSAVNTRISGCSSSASVEFAGEGEGGAAAYVGGILGKGGEGVTLLNCRVPEGEMVVTSTCANAYVGGIAGKALSVTGCTMNGTLEANGYIDNLYLAGVTPVIGNDSSISGNTFGGVIVVAGNSLHNYVGGLYAKAEDNFKHTFDAASDMSSCSGTIRIDAYKSDAGACVYAGGILGYAGPGAKLGFKGYDVQTKLVLDNAVDRTAANYCAGGIFGGTASGTKVNEVSFENIKSQGLMSFRFTKSIKSGVLKGFYGGVVGYIYGTASFNGCVNQGNVGVATSDSNVNAGAKNDSSVNFVGGVAGYIEGGNVTINSCRNEAMVHNLYYCNQSAYNNADGNYLSNFHGVIAGGILGGFDMNRTPGTFTISITNCATTASVDAIRGLVGGIVGFCQNATISECTYSSKEYTGFGNQIGAHQGGIVGAVSKATIDRCTVKSTIHAGTPGSSDFSSPGGIVGRVIPGDPVKVTNSKFFGTIIATPSNGTLLYPGGLVGAGESNTLVTDCFYGGTLKKTDKNKSADTWSVNITENNLETYAIGNNTGLKTNIGIWAGE